MARMSVQRLQQYQQKGIIKRYEVGKVDLIEVAGDIIEHQRRIITGRQTEDGAAPSDQLDFNVERTRLTKEQADKTELEVRRMRGELVPVAALKSALMLQDIAVKDRLLAVPMSAAERAYNASVTDKVQGIVDVYEREIRDALNDLASTEVVEAVAH